jgi:hypothetical protein
MGKRVAGSLGVILVAAALAGCGSTARTTTGAPATSSTGPTTSSTGPATSSTGPAGSATGPVSSRAPSLVVCGQLVSASAAGPVVYDIASRHYATVTEVTVGGVIYVRVSDSCSRGAVVKITPPTAFETVRTVRATDGGAVLVELRPELRRQLATLTATATPTGASEVLRLDVAMVTPGTLACNPRPCTVTPIPAKGLSGQ